MTERKVFVTQVAVADSEEPRARRVTLAYFCAANGFGYNDLCAIDSLPVEGFYTAKRRGATLVVRRAE